ARASPRSPSTPFQIDWKIDSGIERSIPAKHPRSRSRECTPARGKSVESYTTLIRPTCSVKPNRSEISGSLFAPVDHLTVPQWPRRQAAFPSEGSACRGPGRSIHKAGASNTVDDRSRGSRAIGMRAERLTEQLARHWRHGRG